MTIFHLVRCDGYDCHNELELDHDNNPETVLTSHGYMNDPDDGYTHYCAVCAPKVQKEIDAKNEEEESQWLATLTD
ncbi:MAG: hypothetical protein JKY50_09415 [Oleispira sp.]|nr:hypothetical protein [Oleispira sp.]